MVYRKQASLPVDARPSITALPKLILAFSLIQDILPSDGPDSTRGSSLFGTLSPLPKNSAGNAKATKLSAASPRKTNANESDSEATESESEWEKERAFKKAQKEEEQEKVFFFHNLFVTLARLGKSNLRSKRYQLSLCAKV